MSTNITNVVYPSFKNIGWEQSVQEYNMLFQTVLKDVTASFEDLLLCTQHLTDVLEYSTAGQDHYTGFTIPILYKMFENNRNLTYENIKVANIVGHSTDLMFTACQITDDLIDGSPTKLGKPCLHEKDGIGMNAITDALLVSQCSYLLLKKYLHDHPSYLSILDATRLMATHLSYGQTMDMLSTTAEFSLKLYTEERFNNIMLYKSTYPVFFYPIITALRLSNQYNEKRSGQVEKISHLIGLYYGAQNDMIDCYGDSSKLGSVGRDIVNGKCTWLVVKALEVATEEQRKIIEKHYRKPNRENDWEVRKLYNELDILNLFVKFEKESRLEITKEIEKIDEILREPFKKIISVLIQSSVNSN